MLTNARFAKLAEIEDRDRGRRSPAHRRCGSSLPAPEVLDLTDADGEPMNCVNGAGRCGGPAVHVHEEIVVVPGRSIGGVALGLTREQLPARAAIEADLGTFGVVGFSLTDGLLDDCLGRRPRDAVSSVQGWQRRDRLRRRARRMGKSAQQEQSGGRSHRRNLLQLQSRCDVGSLTALGH